MCQDCGIKWFIPGHRVAEPDLTECGACGGSLKMFAGHPGGGDGHVSPPGEDEGQAGWT